MVSAFKAKIIKNWPKARRVAKFNDMILQISCQLLERKILCKNLMSRLSFKNPAPMSVFFSHSQICFSSRIYLLFKLFPLPYPWWWEVPTRLWGMHSEVECQGQEHIWTCKAHIQPRSSSNDSHKHSTPMALPQTFPSPWYAPSLKSCPTQSSWSMCQHGSCQLP